MPQFKLSDREKILAVAAACFAVFYLFYQFLFLPKWNEIGKLREKARAARLEFKIAESKIKILDTIGKEFFPPPSPEPSRDEKALEFLKLLSQATAKSGLDVSFIKPLLEGSGAELKFDISCSGRYRSLHDFIYILSQLNLLVLIDNLDVSSSGGAEPVLDIKMALTAFTFFSTQETIPSPPEGKLVDPFALKISVGRREEAPPAPAAAPGEAPKPAELKLEGVWVDARMRVAFISGQALPVGEAIGGWRVTSISKDRVILRRGSETKILKMEEK